MVGALIDNLRITETATEADIEALMPQDIAIEYTRQSGKTTSIVHTVEDIMIFLTRLYGRPISIGIFAPQKEQAKTDFDRLKSALERTRKDLIVVDHDANRKAKEESNSRTLVLGNGSSCYIFPISSASKPESKTLDLIIIEESQDADDKIVKEQILPMGASTNAPVIWIGTAGTRLCNFYWLIDKGKAMVMRWREIVADRRRMYDLTADPRHLIYERFVKGQIDKYGENSDEVRRPYNNEWLLEAGMYITTPELTACRVIQAFDHGNMDEDHYFGLDTAKVTDQTVLKIGRLIDKRLTMTYSLELRGLNYVDQFNVIKEVLGHFKIASGAIDSTGQGDFMPDMFERETGYQIYRMKFSLQTKDQMYKTLYQKMVNDQFGYYAQPGSKSTDELEHEFLNLVKDYQGQYMRVHHSDAKDAHDDHPDAIALMNYAFDSYNVGSGIKTYYEDLVAGQSLSGEPTPWGL